MEYLHCLEDIVTISYEPLQGTLKAFEQVCDSGYELQLVTACRALLEHAQRDVCRALEAVRSQIGVIELAHERPGDFVDPGRVIGVYLRAPGNSSSVQESTPAARDDSDYRFAKLTQAEIDELQKVFDILRNGTLEDIRGLMAVLSAIHRPIMTRALGNIGMGGRS